MKLLRYGTLLGPGLGLGLALCSAQTSAPEAPLQAPTSALPADPLGLVQGLGEMKRLTELEQDPVAAKLVGEQLLGPGLFTSLRATWDLDLDSWWQPLLDGCESALDALRWNGHTRGERAHVHFALGVARLAAGEAQEARTEFRMAGARAGRGDLRQDATYNVGTIALLAGEAWRALMPEFGGTPPAPAGPPVPGAQEEEQPAPIEMARGAYLEARGGFTQRLRMDWQDADTRANMELVMRRLRELDKIEEEREQEQQDQEEQEQDPENEESEDPQEDPEEGDKSEQEPDESESPEEPQDPEDPEDPEESEEPEPQEGEEDEPNEEQPAEPEEQAHQEIFLTKEEVERLLKKLQRHEEQGEELRERRRANRRPTARDW